ncbi:cation:proton antiporter [Desulfovibrio subterraneus]|uniref:Sodium:proton antiporter n=1 Tax=Desulfovibrio subterraneus TaxID=2718620 RepID=A0A7J0BJL3_9BACT|nr:cation:proton antiporter [Desulfovibrio subterraneus]GFM33829.1 sodium:proton antiporter [Desulfovibrio subterraneus]
MIVHQAYSLLLVSGAALILPGVSRILRIPAPVAEILFGVLLGKSLLHLQFSGEWLPFLAELGFLMLMFQSGMEIDFSVLTRQSAKEVLLQFVVFCGTVAGAFAITLFLGLHPFMALVLSTTSLGLVMPTLRETGLLKTMFGQRVLIASTLADFLTLLAITLFMLWDEHGLSLQLISPLPLFIGFGLLLRMGRLWAWWNPDKVRKLLDSEGNLEMGVRFSLALLFLFVAFSELVHLEPVLGAFMGGCVLSYVFRAKETLEGKLSALGFGFLVPVFFINVGMQFDLSNVLRPDMLILTALLLVFAFLVKVIPAFLFGLRGMKLRDSLRAGVLLSSRLSLIVAAAELGVSRGFVTPAQQDAIILLAMLTCLLGPTLFKLLSKTVIQPQGRAGESA